MKLETIRKKLWLPRNDIDAPIYGPICNWIRAGEEDTSHSDAPFIDMLAYGKLLRVLPDKVVESLEKSRLAQDGKLPLLTAGMGYVELLAPIIVDGTAIASSSAEARLVPAIRLGTNQMAPFNIPGKSLRVQARGRVTTLTTAATMTFRLRIGTTDVITGTTVMASGAITQDATAQTNTMWEVEGHLTMRAVGSAGSAFGMGDTSMAPAAFTIANQQALFMSSAGSSVPAAITWDTTVDQYLQLTGQWSLATAYSIQTHLYYLEALGPI